MKKILFLIISIFSLTGLSVFADEAAIESTQSIRQGTFIKVMVPIEFSSLESDIGDEVLFLNTQDMYIYETNAIPKDTKIYGVIEDIKEPVMGRDAGIKVLINKMITPDKKVYMCQGHVYTENDNYIGRKETGAMYYRRVPHYHFHMRPFLQAVPLKVYEMGKHTEVKPGSEFFIILDEDLQLK